MTDTRQRLKTLLWVVFGALALWFTIQGGEYGTSDLVRQGRQRRRLVHDIDSLRREVDSLTKYKQRLLTDPKTQERVAREQFGMVRGKELLYRFVEQNPK